MDQTVPVSTSNQPADGESNAQSDPTVGLTVAHYGSQEPSSASTRISAVAMFYLRLKDGSFCDARPTVNCYRTTKLRTFYEFARANSRLPLMKMELTDVLMLDRKFSFFVDVSMESAVQDGAVYQFRLLEEGAFRAPPECPRRLQAAMRASLVDGHRGVEQNTNVDASGNAVETCSSTVQSNSAAQQATIVENQQASSAASVNTSNGSSDPVATRKRKAEADTTEGVSTTPTGSKECPTFTDLLPLLLTTFDFCLPPEIVSEADNLLADADPATTTNVGGSKDWPTFTHLLPLLTDSQKEHFDGGLVTKAASTDDAKVNEACNGHAHALGPKQISQKPKKSKPSGTTTGLQGTHTMPENKAPHATTVPSSSSSSQPHGHHSPISWN